MLRTGSMNANEIFREEAVRILMDEEKRGMDKMQLQAGFHETMQYLDAHSIHKGACPHDSYIPVVPYLFY